MWIDINTGQEMINCIECGAVTEYRLGNSIFKKCLVCEQYKEAKK
jgi:hypothetical protein